MATWPFEEDFDHCAKFVENFTDQSFLPDPRDLDADLFEWPEPEPARDESRSGDLLLPCDAFARDETEVVERRSDAPVEDDVEVAERRLSEALVSARPIPKLRPMRATFRSRFARRLGGDGWGEMNARALLCDLDEMNTPRASSPTSSPAAPGPQGAEQLDVEDWTQRWRQTMQALDQVPNGLSWRVSVGLDVCRWLDGTLRSAVEAVAGGPLIGVDVSGSSVLDEWDVNGLSSTSEADMEYESEEEEDVGETRVPKAPAIHGAATQPSSTLRVTKTKLKSDADAPSASWSTGKLKRSSSQPNLAQSHQMDDDDEMAEAGAAAPASQAFDGASTSGLAAARRDATPDSVSARSASSLASQASRRSGAGAGPEMGSTRPSVPSRELKPRVSSGGEADILNIDSVQLTHMRPEYGRTNSGLTGLRNLGNSCYMNSVLQALANTKALVIFVQRGLYHSHLNRDGAADHRGEIMDEFAIIIKALWAGCYKSISPSKFKQTVSRHNSMFASNDQQDSQEFLLFLLDGLHEDLNEAPKQKNVKPPPELEDERLPYGKRAQIAWQWHKKLNESFIVDSFQGQFKSSVRCLTCGFESTTFDVFMYLSLQIPNGFRCKLMDCVNQFEKEEHMTGSSQWHCSRCKTMRDAVKKIDIWRLPPYLLIHLKRFSYDNSLRQKMNTLVDFPLNNLELTQADSSSVYDLYAVSNHYGSMESGHYTAFCLNPVMKKWHKFDDEIVTPISTSNIKSSAAYILFYARAEAPRAQTRPAL